MTTALRVALLGAESTGKTTLAQALQARLADEFGLQVVVVPEVLRQWCDARGRTPRRDEQAGIAEEQQRRIDAAAASADLVLCDTTPLMTAVYSQLVFGDHALDDLALAAQSTIALTLLTAVDLPWIADGLQRDGPQVRGPVDAGVRAMLRAAGGDWTIVQGLGEARVACAIDALRPLLRRRAAGAAPGLFKRLAASRSGPPVPRWRCPHCDLPACEHALRGAARP